MIGVETDGQYENAYCGDDSGDHHHNGCIGSWHSQMTTTDNFNKALKAIGIAHMSIIFITHFQLVVNLSIPFLVNFWTIKLFLQSFLN
jgi:hypothetical protein